MLDIVTPGKFDFVYVPHDKHKHVNIALAFINFVDSSAAKEAQDFFHILNEAHWSWNIVASPGNIQGFPFNLAYYAARFGFRAIREPYAPLLFKGGRQLTDPKEITQAYALLPPSVMQEAKSLGGAFGELFSLFPYHPFFQD